MNNPTVLGPKTSYVEILNHFTQAELTDKAKEPKRYNPLRPSSAGKDPRELAYEFMEYRGYAQYDAEVMDPQTHRLLDLGGVIEKHLLYHLKQAFQKAGGDMEIRYQQQTLSFFRLPDGSLVEGNCDAVFLPKSKKFGGCIADVKSKKDKFSMFYKTAWEELSAKLSGMKSVQCFGEESFWVEDVDAFIEELDDYFFAMNFYQLNMYFFDEHQFLRSRGIDHACILQYSKNDSRLREIRFKPSESIYQKVKDKFCMVQKIVDETKDPTQVPRENVLGSAAVAFSKYKKIDWPEDDALKAFFNTLPAKQWPKDLDRLPAKEANALKDLFAKYKTALEYQEKLEGIEQKIVGILDSLKVFKVRFDEDNIYQMKRLKSGGVGGGERLVLRRGKL